MARPKISKSKQKKIAKERIDILFKQAQEQNRSHPELSNRYIFLARKLAMKLRLKFSLNQKRQFCKNCYIFFVPNKNVRIRVSRGKIVTLCLKCKHISRVPYYKQQKEKRIAKLKK